MLTRNPQGLLLSLLLIAAPLYADTPTARELLDLVRANQSAQYRDLSGTLRRSTSEQKTVIPFQLRLRGNTITYQFTDRPETLTLRLEEKGSRFDGNVKLSDRIRGTGISYEDLSLKFLYWTNAIVEPRREVIKTRNCWIVRAAPNKKSDSQYEWARFWIEPSGGLLKAECYANGKLACTYTVISVQRAEEGRGYILKNLRIQRADDRHPTYLEVRQD